MLFESSAIYVLISRVFDEYDYRFLFNLEITKTLGSVVFIYAFFYQ